MSQAHLVAALASVLGHMAELGPRGLFQFTDSMQRCGCPQRGGIRDFPLVLLYGFPFGFREFSLESWIRSRDAPFSLAAPRARRRPPVPDDLQLPRVPHPCAGRPALRPWASTREFCGVRGGARAGSLGAKEGCVQHAGVNWRVKQGHVRVYAGMVVCIRVCNTVHRRTFSCIAAYDVCSSVRCPEMKG